jgi:hypothetical protein
VRTLALVCLLAPAGLSGQQADRVQRALPGPLATVTRPLFACPTVGSFETQRSLARSGDGQEWVAFMEKAECIRVPASIVVLAEPLEDRTDVVRIRTDVPIEDGGWEGWLYADAGDVRRPDP